MKQRLSIGVCVLISLALFVFGVLYGVVSGFHDDRAYVLSLWDGDNGLRTALDYRGADGLNLCVVARRHLPGDMDISALEAAALNLRNPQATPPMKKQADARLTETVTKVAEKLRDAPSLRQNARDSAYLEMLAAGDMVSQSALIHAYNQAAEDFNRQLEGSFIGAVARILGATPCELYR